MGPTTTTTTTPTTTTTHPSTDKRPKLGEKIREKVEDKRHRFGEIGEKIREKVERIRESIEKTKRSAQDDREGLHFPPECKKLFNQPKVKEELSCARVPMNMVLVDRWALFDGESLNPRVGLHGQMGGGGLMQGGAHVSGGNCDHVMCDCYQKPSNMMARPPPMQQFPIQQQQ